MFLKTPLPCPHRCTAGKTLGYPVKFHPGYRLDPTSRYKNGFHNTKQITSFSDSISCTQCICNAYSTTYLPYTICSTFVLRGDCVSNFKIPSIPPTTNKTIRFPNDVIDHVEKAIEGKDCTFSAFVIAAVRAALEELDKESRGDK